MGVIHIGLMILARFSYTQMRPIFIFYVAIPFVLEFSVIFSAYFKFRVMAHVENLKRSRSLLL